MDPTFQEVLEEHLGIFLIALFLSLITCFIAWYKRYFKLPDYDRKKVSISFREVVTIFLIYFGVSLIVPFILVQIVRLFPDYLKAQLSTETDTVKAWINLISITLLFGVFCTYFSCLSKESRHSVLGEGSYHGFFTNCGHFGMGLLTWLISFPLVLAVSQAFSILLVYLDLTGNEQVAVRFLKSTMNIPFLFLITSLFVIFIIPTIEELLFRGFLQNWLSKFFGRIGAIILTAVIFSSFHFSLSQGWSNLEILPSLFTLALFLGFVYFRQKSIWASIGLHSAFNAINIYLMSQSPV
jgi:membrane protease YdiL (CAAX protease family)